MKTSLVAPYILLMLGSLAHAQVAAEPVASSPSFGFSLPSVEGTMTYALSGSESFFTGEGGNGLNDRTALSGNAAYLSSSVDKPFSLVYSGGYLYTSVLGYPASSTFQNLAASQVVATKNWNFVVDDGMSYLPETPTTGLSGIPGVGDIGVTPVQVGDEPTQDILTNYASRIGNGLNGGVTRQINASTSINGSASWRILHFFSNQGIDSTGEMASVGPTYRIDARSSASAVVTYARTTDQYQGTNLTFTSEGVRFEYQRQLSPFFSVNASLGPQRTYGSGEAASFIAPQINLVGNAGIVYARRYTSATLSYFRATNSGSGVLYGSLSDGVAFSVRQQFSRNWQAALTGAYTRSSSLARLAGFDESFQSVYGGVQASRKISRSLSGYASYTAVTQSSNNPGALQSIFSGLTQVFAVGLTYSPEPLHLGHF